MTSVDLANKTRRLHPPAYSISRSFVTKLPKPRHSLPCDISYKTEAPKCNPRKYFITKLASSPSNFTLLSQIISRPSTPHTTNYPDSTYCSSFTTLLALCTKSTPTYNDQLYVSSILINPSHPGPDYLTVR